MTSDDTTARRTRRLLRPALLVAGAAHLLIGLLMAIDPERFYDSFASYPPYNAHFLRDVSSFYLALGAVLLVAAARRAWQVPLLVLAVVQYALHTVVHVIDVGDTDPSWMGPVNLVVLAVVCAALWGLLRVAGRQ